MASTTAGPPGRPARPDRMFGIKDLFTTINAMGGVIAICLCIDGRPFWAGVSMLVGYLAGDTVDGWIARKLGTSNQFGAEYDTIADHLSHCIAPGAIVYTVYRHADLGLVDWFQHGLAIALGGAIMVTASIRHARNIVRPIEVKGIWVGLPRTVLGFIAVAYVDAALAPRLPGGLWAGVVLIPVVCAAALTYWPFPNHRMARSHFAHVRFFIALFFVTTIGVLAWRPAYVFDVLFFWMFGYSTTSWLSLTRAERAAYYAKVREALAAA
ncbi:MAG: CDP-alcohol phosphatidyltransferase family protein [Kofleriaceae bacterium]